MQSNEIKLKTEPEINSKPELRFFSIFESFRPTKLKIPQICKLFINILI